MDDARYAARLTLKALRRERRLDDDLDVVAEGIGDRTRLLGLVRVGRELFLRDPRHRARDLQADLRNLEAVVDFFDRADGLRVKLEDGWPLVARKSVKVML